MDVNNTKKCNKAKNLTYHNSSKLFYGDGRWCLCCKQGFHDLALRFRKLKKRQTFSPWKHGTWWSCLLWEFNKLYIEYKNNFFPLGQIRNSRAQHKVFQWGGSKSYVKRSASCYSFNETLNWTSFLNDTLWIRIFISFFIHATGMSSEKEIAKLQAQLLQKPKKFSFLWKYFIRIISRSSFVHISFP